MKAYCINLARRPDRLDYITATFAKQSVPFVHVNAVDGTDPLVAARADQLGPSRLGPKISATALACFESHRAAWRLITDSGQRYGMVMEDDVLLAEGFAQYLADSWVPADADVVRLETFGIRVHVGAGKGIPAGGRRLFSLKSYHPGCGCYVIDATAAARMIDATATIYDPVDYTMFSQDSPLSRTLKTYQMIPAPVIQGDRAVRGNKVGWAASSIQNRFGTGEVDTVMKKESKFGRFSRRIQEELIGQSRRTRYRFVAHG